MFRFVVAFVRPDGMVVILVDCHGVYWETWIVHWCPEKPLSNREVPLKHNAFKHTCPIQTCYISVCIELSSEHDVRTTATLYFASCLFWFLCNIKIIG